MSKTKMNMNITETKKITNMIKIKKKKTQSRLGNACT